MATQIRVQIHQEIFYALELARGFESWNRRIVSSVDTFQDQRIDGTLTEIVGNLGTGVVSAKRLLVDILLKDIAEDVRIEFIVFARGGIVQIPGIVPEETED